MADGTVSWFAGVVSWFAGVDWGSERHQVCLLDAAGQVVGERAFRHDGAGLAALCDWLGAGQAGSRWPLKCRTGRWWMLSWTAAWPCMRSIPSSLSACATVSACWGEG